MCIAGAVAHCSSLKTSYLQLPFLPLFLFAAANALHEIESSQTALALANELAEEIVLTLDSDYVDSEDEFDRRCTTLTPYPPLTEEHLPMVPAPVKVRSLLTRVAQEWSNSNDQVRSNYLQLANADRVRYEQETNALAFVWYVQQRVRNKQNQHNQGQNQYSTPSLVVVPFAPPATTVATTAATIAAVTTAATAAITTTTPVSSLLLQTLPDPSFSLNNVEPLVQNMYRQEWDTLPLLSQAMYFHDAVEYAATHTAGRTAEHTHAVISGKRKIDDVDGDDDDDDSFRDRRKRRKRSKRSEATTYQGRRLLCTMSGYIVLPNTSLRGNFEPGQLVQLRNAPEEKPEGQEEGQQQQQQQQEPRQKDFTTCVVMEVSSNGDSAQVVPLANDSGKGRTTIHKSDDEAAWYLMPLGVGTATDASFDNLIRYTPE